MEKRKVIIITIISTILSLVMILFSYFGITRYLSLHVKSSESFINEYSKLPKAGKERVVISFTTTPDKVKKLKPMINSILDQTVKVDTIALVIPYKYKGKNYDIPKYIKDVANIFPAGKDYGDGTKLIPMLFREMECNTTIIALDDNIVYGQDFIYTMIEESKKNPNSVLVDKKGTAILVKPEHFGCDVINREKENFDDKWFLSRSKGNKIVHYGENYSTIGF
jgi:hypothetical protein